MRIKGNGKNTTRNPGHTSLQMLPDGELTQIDRDTIMDCDYCGKPMDFEIYSSHHCDGLNGLNPWQEKTRNAVWVKPGMFGGKVRASGTVLLPEDIKREYLRRFFRRGVRIFLAVLLCSLIGGISWLAYG